VHIHLALHGFPPLSDGGTQQYTLALARRLQAEGHRVTVLAYAPGTTREVAVREDLAQGVRVLWLTFNLHLTANPMREEFANPRVARCLERLWQSERPSLVHVTYLGLLSTATVSTAQALGIPTAVTLTDMWAICPVGTLLRHDGELCTGPADLGDCVRCLTIMGPRGGAYAGLARALPPWLWRVLGGAASLPGLGRLPYFSWLRALGERPAQVRQALLSAGALLSPGRFLVTMLERNGYPAGSVRALPHGVESPERLRRPTPVCGGGPLRLGYIGPLAWFKGAHVPVEAFRRLPAGADLTLAYYGAPADGEEPGSYARNLMARIAATPGASHRGAFPNERVAQVLAEIDVLLMPSLCYENTPLVIYEALASGTPVIATAEGGMRELVEELGGGWLLPRGDVAALADLLQRLREHPDEVRRMADTIRPVPSLAEHVEALEGVYARLTRTGGQRD
jgi:glycosyltransferase involved in cell wall biosynthesis